MRYLKFEGEGSIAAAPVCCFMFSTKQYGFPRAKSTKFTQVYLLSPESDIAYPQPCVQTIVHSVFGVRESSRGLSCSRTGGSFQNAEMWKSRPEHEKESILDRWLVLRTAGSVVTLCRKHFLFGIALRFRA